ncbi:cytochrome P450 [Pseudovibrio sp. Tun.PSC04-5.I4]|uniref:cytochrome P450 n=1 Tax=Pseudovibrio sp. Tun.PSC04-5.I4 TaxID=1798213 RepID=UPI000884BCB6|nr:cytochrome P450 [Pseudovibrio sp. Tun.PSC04-5.I4]SDQ16547.1 Cytochrome P450 [Pseudovibrio sp. Tun.PSC04-5.I4]
MPVSALYKPPAPTPCKPLRGLRLLRLFWSRNVLDLIPEDFFNSPMERICFTRRPCYLVNCPKLVNEVLVEKRLFFPKSDVMVDTLRPVIGDSTIIASGPKWEEQREMIAPVFSHIGVRSSYKHIQDACTEFLAHLDQVAKFDKVFSLQEEMSRLTADILFRTIFTHPIDSIRARKVFSLAMHYQSITTTWARKMILRGAPGETKRAMPKQAIALRDQIRLSLRELVDEHTADRHGQHDDMCQRLMDARHPQTGMPFSKEQLVDHIATFFLAGHETTSAVLNWAFFILSERPDYTERIRRETDNVTSGEVIEYKHLPRLKFTRNVFRETTRLYPPIAFLTRMASEETQVGDHKVAQGSLIIISPWVAHRHRTYWNNPDYFDPDRFERNDDPMTRAFMPFGIGPRVCAGASFATVEATLLLARLTRYYSFKTINSEEVYPETGISLRSASEIKCKLIKRGHVSEYQAQ